MTGKQALGLEDDEAGNGADAPASDADAPPGGDTEAGRDADRPSPPANMAASARRRGGRRGGNSGQAAGGKDAGQESAGRRRRYGGGQRRDCAIASPGQRAHHGRREENGEQAHSPGEAGEDAGRERGGQRHHAAATGGTTAGSGERGAAEGAAKLLERIGTHAADFGRWVELERRGRRRWWALAIAAGFPAFLLLGLLAEQQFQVIPLHDPTGGWRGHVWEQYGRTIVDCAVEAMRTDAEVDCPLVVRRP